MSNPDADPPIERLIADDFKSVPTISMSEFCQRAGEAHHAHGGRWPTYATACHAQYQRWVGEATAAQRFNEFPSKLASSLRIMNVQVIERPGPITLIWSEQL